jgi:hypothetical protein
MTHAATRRRRGSVWILPGVIVLAIWLSSLLGLLSRSVVVDFLSWWPVWLAVVGIGFALRGRKVAKFNASGLVSIGASLLLVAFLIGHIQGWPVMPSTSGELVGGTDQGFSAAAVSARVGDGGLKVGVGSPGVLYTAGPLRDGGSVGLPQALERAQGDAVSVELTQVADPGWYQFSGWEIGLSPSPAWGISLEGSLQADLSGLTIESLQMDGDGSVILGTTDANVPVSVSGEFVVEVPEGQAVRVIGPAEVPADWVRNESETVSPAQGDGWIVSVADGSVVRIKYR